MWKRQQAANATETFIQWEQRIFIFRSFGQGHRARGWGNDQCCGWKKKHFNAKVLRMNEETVIVNVPLLTAEANRDGTSAGSSADSQPGQAHCEGRCNRVINRGLTTTVHARIQRQLHEEWTSGVGG